MLFFATLFYIISPTLLLFFFFFNDTATTEIYTLSLHDALPIYRTIVDYTVETPYRHAVGVPIGRLDRKSTRLNSSHTVISYAVFCLKKKKTYIKKIYNSEVIYNIIRSIHFSMY